MAEENLADNRTVKHSIKDSVFTTLFRDVNNVLELYRKLHPEDIGVTADDIQIETLETVLVNEIYNDLGFIVNYGDSAKYVILVEAQSKWTENITLRMLFYVEETYRRYLIETAQSEHDSDRVHLPKPELYIVYMGNKKINDELSFSETFFEGDAALDLKVNVLNQVGTDTLYGQFIGFSKVYNEQRKKFGNKLECVRETIRICLEKGFLTDILTKHKQEVNTMLSSLFDEQAQREQYDKAMAKRYEAKGEAKGRAEGEAKGRAEGEAKGRAEGEAKGRAEGEARGMLKSLVSLFRKGRLTLAEASEEANMSEKEFEDLAASMS